MKTRTILITMFLFFLIIESLAQDKLIKKNQEVINGKIIEVGINEIKYKAQDNLDGPNYIIPKDEVLLILYENGKIEKIATYDTNKKDKKSNIVDSNYLKYNNTISIDLLSPVFKDISVAYEKRINKKTLIGFKVPVSFHYSKNHTPGGYPINGLNIGEYYQYVEFYGLNYSVISTTNDSVLVRYQSAKQSEVSNVGIRTGLQTKFYFTQPKKVSWFIGPELLLGYSQGKIVKQIQDEEYWIAKDEYYFPDNDNPVLAASRNYEEIFSAKRLLMGIQFTTGFEYRPIPRLSLGVDVGLGYATIIDFGDLQYKDYYRDALGEYSISYVNPIKSTLTWRGAFNLGINF